MKQQNKTRAEWLISRALTDGDNRKMRRGLMVAVKIRRANGQYAEAAEGMRQLRKLSRNMRKYRKWKAENHPTATRVRVEITETNDQQ